MTTKYHKRGSSYHVVDNANLHLEPRLPVGTYGVMQNPETGELYLETIEDFPELGKLYGDTVEKAQRIWDTFTARKASTGVLLTGEKGCGKTMLAKLLSIIGRNLDVPTIVVNKPYCGEHFNQFVQSITQPCVIIFDEYEKVYDEKKHQDLLLTLLDGVFPTKKLFVLTTNDRHGVNSKMLNRPGRIFYSIEYKGLSEGFIREYCVDNLKRKADANGVAAYAKLFEHFNFDMLKALVEEMNRYKETARQASSMMNMKVESWQRMMDVEVMANGKPIPHSLIQRTLLDPSQGFSFEIYQTKQDEESRDGWHISVDMNDLISIANEVYTYELLEKMPEVGGKRSRHTAGVKMKNQLITVIARPANFAKKNYEELALAV